ncbi:MAG: deoxyribodipyrimidine photo-lyase [Pseudomonadota bacterium]
MSDQAPVIVWFRQDLRLTDNPALSAAAAMGAPILPVYILDDANAGLAKAGAASRWWLHQSLVALYADMDGALLCFDGDAEAVLPRLAANTGAEAVFWNRCYEPWRIDRDKRIKTKLLQSGLRVRSFNGSLLFEPPNVTKKDGTPYKVFTPFYRKGCLQQAETPRKPTPVPAELDWYRERGGETVDDLDLMPSINWYNGIAEEWTPGEAGAAERLEHFLDAGLRDYAQGRDRPDMRFVSRLSPHLHLGEISPNTVWYAAKQLEADQTLADQVDKFQTELGWREFSYHLLYYFPKLPEENLQPKFDRFPWREDAEALETWQRGQTGYPIVDAGMRELWQTGYMHNRVRMIVGSFLVKNLLLDWREGEAWFWDTLVDADLANNSAGWQWIGGCGADAAPYFRIFNPISQGRKFDPDGGYVRQYVPELAGLSNKYIHAPFEASPAELADAGVTLGRDYPAPMVDLKSSRERALAAFKSISGK